jgi:hypothetical protein
MTFIYNFTETLLVCATLGYILMLYMRSYNKNDEHISMFINLNTREEKKKIIVTKHTIKIN